MGRIVVSWLCVLPFVLAVPASAETSGNLEACGPMPNAEECGYANVPCVTAKLAEALRVHECRMQVLKQAAQSEAGSSMPTNGAAALLQESYSKGQ